MFRVGISNLKPCQYAFPNHLPFELRNTARICNSRRLVGFDWSVSSDWLVEMKRTSAHVPSVHSSAETTLLLFSIGIAILSTGMRGREFVAWHVTCNTARMMKPAALITLLPLLAGFASTQTFSSHTGWSFSDTIETATDVLVADILNGSGLDNGSQVTAMAAIRVVRVLQGDIAPSANMVLEWRYQPAPFESPAANAKVPLVRALWLLQKKPDGSFEPLQVSGMQGLFGGFFLELPASPVFYRPDADLQSKIAHEVGLAVEDLAARHAEDFAPHRPEPPLNGTLAPWVRTRMQFESLLMILDSLKKKATADVYRDFSTSNDANLKLLGLMGRIAAGDIDAILALEKDLPRLASAFAAARASQQLMGIDLGKNLPAAHALGRMAVNENTIPGLEFAFAIGVASTHSPEFVPYLIAMLDSPDLSIRDEALMTFCNLLGPAWDQRAKPQGRWDPEMTAYCPSSAPMNDRQQEQRDIQFWKRWWESHREEIGKATSLTAVMAPARYSEPQRFQQITEIPLEVRFQALLNMVRTQVTHYHSETPS